MASPTIKVQGQETAARWSLPTRLAFRFCFVYFPLYALCSGIFPNLMKYGPMIPDPETHWPTRQIISWVGAHVFDLGLPLAYRGAGGDFSFDWVLVFCLLVVAALAMAVWSALDRKREHYTRLHQWFRLLLRFGLITQMLAFGIEKAIPLQMPFPSPERLVMPLGSLGRGQLLWDFIGASPVHEIFAGCAEVIGAILLFAPRTITLGAVVCVADMVQVVMLNVAYDYPAKLYSFHLLLMAALLLAPDLPRLVDFFLRNRPACLSTQQGLFANRRANRIALAVQILLWLWLMGRDVKGTWHFYHVWGTGAPKPPLYGVWNVEQFLMDGQLRPPLLTEKERWRRTIFPAYPTNRMVIYQMDDQVAPNSGTLETHGSILTFTRNRDKSKVDFTCQRVAEDELILDGEMDGHEVHIQLQLFDLNKYPLVSQPIRWIRK